jgi:hypothetical protein
MVNFLMITDDGTLQVFLKPIKKGTVILIEKPGMVILGDEYTYNVKVVAPCKNKRRVFVETEREILPGENLVVATGLTPIAIVPVTELLSDKMWSWHDYSLFTFTK